jgi:hypothetical protein
VNELSGLVEVRLEAPGRFIPSIVENIAALTMPAAILRNNLIVYVLCLPDGVQEEFQVLLLKDNSPPLSSLPVSVV